MKFAPDETIQISRMLLLLKRGEEIARDCARMQAKWKRFEAPRTSRFLYSQARQENFHAQALQAAILWLAPKQLRNKPQSKALETLYQRTCQALAEGRYAESILTNQIVLEGMGEVVLKAIDSDMEQRQLGLKKLRHTIVHQEKAHHTFGLREFDKAVTQEGISEAELVRLAQECLDLSQQVFTDMAGVFECFDGDPGKFQAGVHNALPLWLQVAV